MNWVLTNIWRPFMGFWQEKRWFGPLMSAVIITMAITLFYDLLKEIGGLFGTGVALLIMILMIFCMVSIHDFLKRKKEKKVIARIYDKPNPLRFKGLIFMVSKPETARKAITYHKGELKYCWLVATPEMSEQADMLKEEFKSQLTGVIIRPIKEKYDTRGCYDLIRDIFSHEAPRVGLKPHEVIADITGGTKPMTVAMLLAALEGEYALEHIPTEFDEHTKEPKGPLPPIQISVDIPPWADEESILSGAGGDRNGL